MDKQLGGLTFALMAMNRLAPVLLLFLLSAVYGTVWLFLPGVIPDFQFPVGALIALADVVILAVCLGAAYLEYSHYRIVQETDHMTVTQGLLDTKETGIPYRRIKSVDLNRSLIDQTIGASSLVITILGEAGEGTSGAEEKIRLPYLPKDFAQKLQDDLLSKAEVEKVDVENPSAPTAAQL